MMKGRLAPSPTGALHVGNARTFLWAWLAARSAGGKVVLRVEDLEKKAQGRVLEEMISDLHWLGLTWDEGPLWDRDREEALKGSAPLPYGDSGPSAPYIQSERGHLYREIFHILERKGLIYPCICSKADYRSPVGAPHPGEAGLRYPGICRDRFPSREAALQARRDQNEPVWRFRVPEGEIRFLDLLHGPQKFDIHGLTGDFPVFRTPEQPYYQLAVVADDLAMGITQVVRGDDLLESTARQILLYQALEGDIPAFGHVPLVVGPDGKRISKRHGDSRIRTFRTLGLSRERLMGRLARWSGFSAGGETTPEALVPLWNWQERPREKLILTPEELALFR